MCLNMPKGKFVYLIHLKVLYVCGICILELGNIVEKKTNGERNTKIFYTFTLLHM